MRRGRMMRQIEIAELDLRYEPFRMRDPRLEGELLCSIRERGVEEPVFGVDTGREHLLLDGFKRLRSARSLSLASLPYESQGPDPAQGIVSLLRVRPHRPLTILEQASFVDELRVTYNLSVGEMARLLSRSKAWVSLRLGLFAELRPAVRKKLFAGQFPVYAYLYSVRPFMRINGIPDEELERFVLASSGKGLSVREIDLLCRSCFEGSLELREQILAGRFDLVLREDRDGAVVAGCSAAEKRLLQELERVRAGMRRVRALAGGEGPKSAVFCAQAGLATTGILAESAGFLKAVGRLHDRCEQA